MSMLVQSILDQYLSEQPTSRSYAERLSQAMRLYEKWIDGLPEAMPPFAAETIRAWLVELSQSLAPSSVNFYRQSILRIARYSTPQGAPCVWVAPIGGFKKNSSPKRRFVNHGVAAEILGVSNQTLKKKIVEAGIGHQAAGVEKLYDLKDIHRIKRIPKEERRKRPRRTARLTDHLDRIVDQYIQAKDLCKKQQERLRRHVRFYVAWLQSRGTTCLQATDSSLLNEWLSEIAPAYAASTVNGHRQSIMTLLRFATPDGKALPRADRIRRQRDLDKCSVAFTREELRLLLEAAPHYQPMTERTFGRGIRGDVIPRQRPDGIQWSDWWEAFIRVGYDSGQYLSDLRLIRWSHIASDGSVSFVRHKTGKMMSFQLTHEAVRAANRLGHPDLLLPWPYDMAAYFAREFKKFVRTASGVRVLGPKSIRRSAITYTYIEQGEEAARILAGHSSFTITAKHYIDWTIARRAIVRPPSL